MDRVTLNELHYAPVSYDHAQMLAKAMKKPGFKEAYEALALEYTVAEQLIQARSQAGLTQKKVAEKMGTTKSAISRLESAGRHSPFLQSLNRYAKAVGCKLQVSLVAQ